MRVEYGKAKTGFEKGIKIITNTRRLFIRALNFFDQIEILVSLLDAYKTCSTTELHRFQSFAPVREKVYTEWFVDG